MRYCDALKSWNETNKKDGAVKFLMPKKGTPEYEAVQKIRTAHMEKSPAPVKELKTVANVIAPGPLDAFRGRSKE
jgi:hypothetical protein